LVEKNTGIGTGTPITKFAVTGIGIDYLSIPEKNESRFIWPVLATDLPSGVEIKNKIVTKI